MSNNWIKASKRLPTKTGKYCCRFKQGLNYSSGNLKISDEILTFDWGFPSMEDIEWLEETEEIKEPSIEEDKISDDELLFKIKPLVDDLIRETEENEGVDNNIQSRLYSDELVKISKQYSNTKLDELEKWCDENNEATGGKIFHCLLTDLKAKIKTLKWKTY